MNQRGFARTCSYCRGVRRSTTLQLGSAHSHKVGRSPSISHSFAFWRIASLASRNTALLYATRSAVVRDLTEPMSAYFLRAAPLTEGRMKKSGLEVPSV